MKRKRTTRARTRTAVLALALLLSPWVVTASLALAEDAAPAADAAPPAAAAPPAPITTADIKGVSGPSTADLAKGDPGGSATGSVVDIPMADSKAGLSLADVVNTV